MSKTFAHIRNQQTAETITHRQHWQDLAKQQRLGALSYGYAYGYAGGGSVDKDWDDLTMADLAGLDHIAKASKEG